jgi:acyl phosphate:glycerol-3-phosphate acyltransferase
LNPRWPLRNIYFVPVTASPLTNVFVTVLAYLIGGLPFGYLFVRFSLGKDVRTMGSGNIGATNVHRTAGRKAGLIVLILDIAKGFLAVWLAAKIAPGDPIPLALATFYVMVGHCYPIFLGFKGGKAVACYVGAFLYVAPLALLAVTVVFVLVAVYTKFISLASILSAVVFPFALWLLYSPAPALEIACVASSLLVIYRHRANIQRLREGKENAFSLKGASE